MHSARANNGYDIAGATATSFRDATRRRTGHVVAINFVIRRRFSKILRHAVRFCSGCTAFLSGRKAAVDAIAIGVVGDEEHATLGLR